MVVPLFLYFPLQGFLALDLYDTSEEDNESIQTLEEELGGVTTFGSEPLNFRGVEKSRQGSRSKLQGDNSGMRCNMLRKEWGGRSNGRPCSLERQPGTLVESLHCEETAAMAVLGAGGLRSEHKLKLQTELLPHVFSAWLSPVVSACVCGKG